MIIFATPFVFPHKVLLRDGVDLISRRRRNPKRGNAGVTMIICIYMSYLFRCYCMPRIRGVRSDDACLIAALDVKMLSWFDLLLVHQSHAYTVTTGTKARA